MSREMSRREALSRSFGAVVGAVGIAGLVAGCDGSGSAGPSASGVATSADDQGPRPLTDAEATTLGGVLFANLSAKGATFAYAGKLTGDDSLAMSGEVDWEHHVGHALVQSKVAEAKVTEIFWNETLVVERRPQLTQLLKTLSRPVYEFFLRPPNIAGRELDQGLAVIMGLAGTQRDNPQLIRQTGGSSFIRTDTLRNTPVTILRYGERNSYWLDSVKGALLRLEANSANGLRPRIVDVLTSGAQTITPPDAKLVIEGARLGELWTAETT